MDLLRFKMQSLRLIIVSASVIICAPLAALNAAPGEVAPAATKPADVAAAGALPAAPAEQGIPQSAQSLGHKGGFVTNSMLVTWIVAVGVILFARFRATPENSGSAVGRAEFLGMAGGRTLRAFSKASLGRTL